MEHILNHKKAHQKYFEEMTAIPHGSYHEQTCSTYLVAFIREHGLKWIQGELYNVIIYKDTSTGYKDCAPVLLQVHTGMVCEKNRDADFDFKKDALKLYIEDGFPKTGGTVLGVDDGVGVAYMLALLNDPGTKHPSLECVFTVQEEMGLFGVMVLKKEYSQTERMTNLDDDGENATCTTSARGVNVIMQKKRILVPYDGNGYQTDMFGLHSGHSGGEIDKEHGNANKLLARVLFTLNRRCDVQLGWIQRGIRDNAIPREASAASVCRADLETVATCVQEMKTIFAKELKFSDAGVDIAMKKVARDGVLCIGDSEEVITLLMTLSNGLRYHSMSTEGLSTASNSIDVVTTQEEAIIINASLRGTMESYVDTLTMEMDALTEVFGFHSEYETRYPAWSYRADSPVCKCLRVVCQKVLGKKLQLVAVHGGLEYGVFKAMNENMDIVTMGPKMQDVYTPQGALDLTSFDATFTLLRAYLEEL